MMLLLLIFLIYYIKVVTVVTVVTIQPPVKVSENLCSYSGVTVVTEPAFLMVWFCNSN